LNTCGAYTGSGKYPQVNDNPTIISRTTDYLATSFPNNSTVIVRHYRTHAENWDGGFSRSSEDDEKALAMNPMPSDTIILNEMKVNGHQVTYNGRLSLAFRTDAANQLIAFDGQECKDLVLDGTRYDFAQTSFKTISFAPESDQTGNYLVKVSGEGTVKLPIPLVNTKELTITSSGKIKVPFRIVDGKIEISVTPDISGKTLMVKNVKNDKNVKKRGTWIDTLGGDSR
jgi:hypothetical protein